jgi:hypothetical protein
MQTVFGSKMTAATMGVLVQLYQYVQINRLGKKHDSESNQTKRALFLLFLILHFHLALFRSQNFLEKILVATSLLFGKICPAMD